MTLSCDCSDDYDFYYEVEEEERFCTVPSTCYGCGSVINFGEEYTLMWRWEYDEDGDESNEAPLGKLCETCSGLYFSLLEPGYCLAAKPGFIKEAMDDYRELGE